MLCGYCGDWNLRRFSLELLLSRALCPPPRQAASLYGTHDVSGENRSEEQHAYDDVLGCAADVGELHAVSKNRDQDQCEEDAEHRARASEDVDAAEHDGRDDVEISSEPEAASACTEPKKPM